MEFLNQIPLGANEVWLVPGLPLASFSLLAIGFHRIRWFAPIEALQAEGARSEFRKVVRQPLPERR